MSAPASRERNKRAIKWGTIIGLPILLLVLLFVFFDWNWLRGPLASYLSTRTGRVVRIDGTLAVALAWSPTVTIEGLHVGNPDWAPKTDMASVERLSVTFKLLPLFVGRLILPAVVAEKPDFALVREASGRANWQSGTNNAPMRLPVINALAVTDGHVTVDDAKRRLILAGTVTTHEGAAAGKGRAFVLEGNGTLNRKPVTLHIEGDPLLTASAGHPYHFDADIRDDTTHILAHGVITRPFDLGGMNAGLSLTGQDLADVYYLTGIAFPDTPPYQLSAQLERNGEIYALRELSGFVGGSDLEGTMTVDATRDRPFVKADLASKQLNFDDLGAFFGAPPAVSTMGKHEVGSPQRKPDETSLIAADHLLPDAPLMLNRVRGTDADVRYITASIHSTDLPLKTLDLHLTLDHGVMTMDPVTLGLVRGQLAGRARIDARQDIPAVSTDLTLGNVRLEEFFAGQAGEAPLSGEIIARARLDGHGLSVHQAASNANGTVALVVPHGEIRQAFAELLGIDVAKGLGLLLAGDQTKTDMRCAIANFRVEKGVMRAENIVLDTGVVLATGGGTVNLNTEALDLRIEGHPKQLRLLHITAPVTLKGHLRKAVLGVDAGKIIAQAGIAGALAFLTPLAAILPFVSPGLAKDADCVALMAEAKSGGISVKMGSITPAAAHPN